MIKLFLHFIKYLIVSDGNICYTPSEVILQANSVISVENL